MKTTNGGFGKDHAQSSLQGMIDTRCFVKRGRLYENNKWWLWKGSRSILFAR